MAYPATIYSQTNVDGTTLVATDDHGSRHNAIGAEIVGIETNLGTNSGTSVLKNMTAGDFAARVKNETFGTSTWIGGTIGTALVGTSTIVGGTANNQVIGTPNITGGTITNGTINSAVIGTSTITGGTVNSPIINTPDVRGFYTTPVSTTVAAGGTATLDLNTSNEWRVTFGTGNATLAVNNAVDGKKFIVSLTQDAAGTRTVTWFSTIKWAGSAAPTLTVTASKRDTFGFVCTGTATYDGFIVGQNI